MASVLAGCATHQDPVEREAPPPPQQSESWLSRRAPLFTPLHADPRWPHFAAALQVYDDDDLLGNVAAISLGNTFSFWRRQLGEDAAIETGVQASVHALFDLDASSSDLVNADYMVGLHASWRNDGWQAQLRALHQSSHLGDEFLLTNAIQRVNLSYEQLEFIASYNPLESLRVYAGAGYLLTADPAGLERWSARQGIEWTGQRIAEDRGIRPVAYLSVQEKEWSDWDAAVSARVGVEFEDVERASQRVQILLEFYDGNAPDGQFYDRDIRYVGIAFRHYY